MSDYSTYDSAIQSIINNNSTVNDKYKQVGNAATTNCDINQIVSQVQNMTVVRNRGGEVIGYDYKYTPPKQPDTSVIGIDSNADNGQYATGGGGQTSGGGAGRYNGSYYAGQVDTSESPDKMGSTGLVSGLISSAWAGVSALGKFGRNIAGTAADAIETLASGVGSAFNDLLVDAGSATADGVRALFGVDSNGNTKMYLDENVIGAYAIKAKEGGFLSDGEIVVHPDGHGMPSDLRLIDTWQDVNVDNHASYVSSGAIKNSYGATWWFWVGLSNGSRNYTMICISETPGTVHFNTAWGDRDLTLIGVDINVDTPYAKRIYYQTESSLSFTEAQERTLIPTPSKHNTTMSTVNVVHDLYNLIKYSSEEIGGVTGVTPQTGATNIIDAITGADPHVVAQQLVTQYPQIMGSPIQVVTMDDSCNEITKNYYSVPISYSPTNLNINAPITGGTQINPSFNPDVSLDLPDINMDNFVDQVIKILGGSGAGEDVTTEPKQENPDTPSSDIDGGDMPVSIPQTGTGDTPIVLPPTVEVSSMWHVYNPQIEALRALGSWLWSSSIWQQIVEMFTNPMEAILGVHAIYSPPDISSQVPVVVGYLTSTVSANAVTSQYKELSCGSVWLTEYFGNVFDYEPYTSIKLYLPYVGIVPLSVADVMRAQLSISYVIDFYTGACVAKVSVNRDGAGGVLYEFPGNCAVEYPISAGSYSRMLQSIVSSVATGITGAVHTGNPILSGLSAGVGLLSGGENFSVRHSGAFGGNHGAMGSHVPYLIITRPQTNTAINFEQYDGYSSNYITQLSNCNGYTKCKEVHLNCPGAYKQELDEIESLLLSGVLFGMGV